MKRNQLTQYITAIMALQLIGLGTAIAGPSGGNVVAGSGTIDASDASNVVINQSSAKMAINWSSYNVGASESVTYNQPSSSAIALNRIQDSNPSQILGNISANGRVFLINTNGIVFGESAQVNAAGFVASSLDVDVNQFMNNEQIDFAAGSGEGAIINRGTLLASSSGVVLVGNQISNSGCISTADSCVAADVSQVTLATGRAGTLDFDGDGLMRFQITQAVANDLGDTNGSAINNSGFISAGTVLLNAEAAANVFTNVINNEGVIQANSIDTSNGTIRLLANGGNIRLAGDQIADGSIEVNAKSGAVTQEVLSSLDAGGDVVITAQQGIEQNGSISSLSDDADGGVKLTNTFGEINQNGIIVSNNDAKLTNILGNTNQNGTISSSNATEITAPNGIITIDGDIDSGTETFVAAEVIDNRSDTGDGGDNGGITDPEQPIANRNDRLAQLANANNEATVINEATVASATASLGLYDVEGTGIRLPPDQLAE